MSSRSALIENLQPTSGDLLADHRPAPGGPVGNLQSPIENRALSFARLLLIVALVGAPWAFGAVVPWAWVALGILASLILFLWGLGSVQQKVLKLAWSPLYIPLGLFFLLGVTQYFYGLTLDRSETRQALVLLAVDAAFFFLTIQLFSTAARETWRAFGLAVLVLAGSLGLFAILEFAAGEQQIYGSVATPGNLLFGPYVNPNHFAGLMEMLVPVSVLTIAERQGKPALAVLAWLATGAGVAVASLLLSGSRGGLLALAAEAAIAVAVLARPNGAPASRRHFERSSFASDRPDAATPDVAPASRRHYVGRSLAAAVATTILAALLLFTWVDPGSIAKRLTLIANVGGPAWVEWAGFRKTVAADSLRMLRDHPLSGVGLGNFETAYPRYQSFASDLWIDHAHNDYVEAVAETGLPGALLILAALAMFLRMAFGNRAIEPSGHRAIVQSPDDPITRSPDHPIMWIRLGAALGCCGMLVHSFFDFNLHIPANAAWFAVLAGLAVAKRQ